MLVRCPSCRSTFVAEQTGPQTCPACGKPLVVPEVAQAAAPQEAPRESGTPWERSDELGMWAAWRQTLTQALFDPSRLFRSVRLDRGAAQVGFGVLTGSVFAIIGDLLERALLAGSTDQMRRLLEPYRARSDIPPQVWSMLESRRTSTAVFVAGLLLVPLVLVVFLYLNAAVTHGMALLLGQAKRGFPATLAACAYAFAPLVLLAIPGCGWIVAIVWTAVLTGIGLKETHGIGAGGAAAAVIAPYALLCCGGCGLSMLITFLMSRGLGQ